MGQRDYQSALCRAYADGELRRAIISESRDWRQEYDLSDAEAAQLARLFREAGLGMHIFIDILAMKHADSLLPQLRQCAEFFGEERLRADWERYYREHRSGLMKDKLDEAIGFVAWLRTRCSFERDAPTIGEDVLRYEETCLALRREHAQHWPGDAPRNARTSFDPSARLHASSHRMLSLRSAPEQWRARADGSSRATRPDAWELRSHTVVVYLKPAGAVRGAVVSDIIVRLLELSDGTRSAHAVAELLAARLERVPRDALLQTMQKLVYQGLLRCRVEEAV